MILVSKNIKYMRILVWVR